MENQKKMQFYGGTFGACLPLLVFMALMITIAALQKVSLVLFCMAGGLCRSVHSLPAGQGQEGI